MAKLISTLVNMSHISVELRFTLLSEEDLLPQTLVRHSGLSNMNMQIPYGSFAYVSKHNIHKKNLAGWNPGHVCGE